jgi:argininosuccinate lyase
MTKQRARQKLWQGRYRKGTNKILEKFSASISFDRKLYPYDIAGSRAHAAMLCDCKLITKKEKDAILGGLNRIQGELDSGTFVFDESLEDIHMHIESRLIALIGAAGEKLHTARSRNDQVVLDLRLYLRDHSGRIQKNIVALQTALVAFAKKNVKEVIPGYTHLQHAQPVLMAHHILAYVEKLERDRDRFVDAGKRADELPLGSGALAGSSLPIDRHKVAKLLGFSRVSANSIDAVSDRDFAVEFLAVAALCGVHLSRLGEDLILWSSQEFNFIDIDETFCTGSSMMPQKKNPDVAELVRGKTGRFIGNLVQLLTVLKGLPMTYNRDMQEDKESVFDSVEQLTGVLEVMTHLFHNIRVQTPSRDRFAGEDFSYATDIAEYLVRKGVPFRKAHQITGGLVSYCLENNTTVAQVDLTTLQNAFAPEFNKDIYVAISESNVIESKTTYGGTASANVRRQIGQWEKRLKSKKDA